MITTEIIQEDLAESLPIPSAEKQLEFLNNIQQLISFADTTATYKYALLLSITRLAIEKGKPTGDRLVLKFSDIADKFIELYWNQAKPFHFQEQEPFILFQSNISQAAIIRRLTEAQEKYRTISKARSDKDAWNKLNRATIQIIKNNPIWRLQYIQKESFEFLYNYDQSTSTEITLLPNVMYCLRTFNLIIEELCQKAWVDTVRLNKQNAHLLDSLPDLDTFLFETDRNQLTRVQPILQEIQGDRCFYCNKPIRNRSAVDHFIPWSLYQVDTAHNFVLADHSCNSQKSNFLADLDFYQKWLERNLEYDAFITEEVGKIGFIADRIRSESIANWAYTQVQNKNGLSLWAPEIK